MTEARRQRGGGVSAPAEDGSVAISRLDLRTYKLAVYDALMEMIVSLELPPGERLVESDLAGRLGVSKTPVREALALLEADGLVESTPYRGASVRWLSMNESEEQGYLVDALEMPAYPMVIERISKQDLAAVGNVEPQATVVVKSPVGGTIMKVHFQDGAMVKRGDPLFEIDTRPYEEAVRMWEANIARDNAVLAQGEANLARAQAQEAHYGKQADRYGKLAEQGIVSREVADQSAVEGATFEALEQLVLEAIFRPPAGVDVFVAEHAAAVEEHLRVRRERLSEGRIRRAPLRSAGTRCLRARSHRAARRLPGCTRPRAECCVGCRTRSGGPFRPRPCGSRSATGDRKSVPSRGSAHPRARRTSREPRPKNPTCYRHTQACTPRSRPRPMHSFAWART